MDEIIQIVIGHVIIGFNDAYPKTTKTIVDLVNKTIDFYFNEEQQLHMTYTHNNSPAITFNNGDGNVNGVIKISGLRVYNIND